jgi:hypothetical protein
VYVYELPPQFNKDTEGLPTIWHPEQYDIDQVHHPCLLSSQIYALASYHAQSRAACIRVCSQAVSGARMLT